MHTRKFAYLESTPLLRVLSETNVFGDGVEASATEDGADKEYWIYAGETTLYFFSTDPRLENART